MSEPAADAIHVVATAGHVDHGKSSLLHRLTGIDPDRLEEEKRRGLTIDLGFAWLTLPSGRQIGFVDVPGHERFIRNMLAGVGPVRLVVFVVAADEGWKPQSEEHLQILDVLGVDAGIVTLTKIDLVDDETLELARAEVTERLAGTALEHAEVVASSSTTGEGIEDLVAALDRIASSAPEPERSARARLHIDRVFAISGAGTVVTGTLTGAGLSTGDEVEVLPGDVRARIRGLQTHKRKLDRALPVSRVAVNLAGVERAAIRRGDVLVHPEEWRTTSVFEGSLSPVRGVSHELSARGAYKLYAGAAERDARVRIYGGRAVAPGAPAFVRIHASAPLVLAPGDRFVLREAGRDETVAGGTVLDAAPPRRAGADPEARLRARDAATPAELPAIVVRERGAIESHELRAIVGRVSDAVPGAERSGSWWLDHRLIETARAAAIEAVGAYQAANPLEPGAPATQVRSAVAAAAGRARRAAADPLLDVVVAGGSLVRDGATFRTPDHRPEVGARIDELELVAGAVAEGGTTPPSITQLVTAGHPRSVIDAAIRAGLLVRIAPDLVMVPALVDRALGEVRSAGTAGITVGELRERLGTSRKYAVPLVEYLDTRGLTIRRGDVRIARGVSA
jgi:selenocysteine-specific elongation factor